MSDYETVIITMKDGKFATWKKDEWNDCTYDGRVFIVMQDGIMVGLYNIDEVRSVVIE